MTISLLSCPACTAPLTIPTEATRVVCSFCGSALQVQGEGDQTTLRRLDQVVDSIRQTSDATHSELRRMQLGQELAGTRMQLSQLESEMRAIARGPQTPVSRRQLSDLQRQAAPLQRRISELERILNAAAPAAPQAPLTPHSFSWRQLGWMLFSWRGRLGRAGFWGGQLVVLVLFMLIGALVPSEAQVEAAGNPLVAPLTLLVFWIAICVAVKRLHDRDKPGWWVLIGLIPLVGLIYLFVDLGVLPGTTGPNQYG